MIGSRVAHYRITAKLGAAGMGEVYRATDHTNITAIYGLEEDAGRVAIVQELVEGETLAERVARGPLPLDDARDIARQIATKTSPAMTEMGVILGTAAYMSPEQARGKSLDKRADIWALVHRPRQFTMTASGCSAPMTSATTATMRPSRAMS